jgi:hypothetical protein
LYDESLYYVYTRNEAVTEANHNDAVYSHINKQAKQRRQYLYDQAGQRQLRDIVKTCDNCVPLTRSMDRFQIVHNIKLASKRCEVR